MSPKWLSISSLILATSALVSFKTISNSFSPLFSVLLNSNFCFLSSSLTLLIETSIWFFCLSTWWTFTTCLCPSEMNSWIFLIHLGATSDTWRNASRSPYSGRLQKAPYGSIFLITAITNSSSSGNSTI